MLCKVFLQPNLCADSIEKKTLSEEQKLNENDYITGFNNSKIGKLKLKHWEFQQEWRYLLHIHLNSDFFFGRIINGKTKMYSDLAKELNYNYKEIFKHNMDHNGVFKISQLNIVKEIYKMQASSQGIFIDFNKKKFEEMEVMIGPNCTKADEIIIESLIKNYNPSAVIVTSTLKGLVR